MIPAEHESTEISAGLSLTVDLAAVAENYRIICQHLAKGATSAAVVKADAYGLGMEECSRTFHQAGCRFFFVTSLDEALAFRKIQKDWPVATLHGLGGLRNIHDISAYYQNNIIPCLNSLEEVRLWHAAAKQTGQRLPALLHVDTGMSRLGLPPEEFAQFKEHRDDFSGIAFLYVISHLACADEPDNPATEDQYKKFCDIKEALPDIPGCFANSAGVFYDPKLHFDMVRPGAALYGLQLSPRQPEMQPCLYLTAPVLQLRSLNKGDPVGYGSTWRVQKNNSLIATIPAGYAQGYLRCLGNKGRVYIHGTECPVVGRVSMDLVTIDVTEVADRIKCGDRVEILGKNRRADTVAAEAGTIGYEILTSLGKIRPRLYLR
ncbi:MAG: alanine racemase [Micavibrio sp.]|nr:MAG: alanine racemase [Micavibrio sp.]